MSAPPENTLADPEQLIADLQCQLAECKVERDEALERETATAEVLQVINSSPGDLAPVFDAILDKALRLCEATHGHIWRVEGQQAHAVALRGDARFIASMPRESRTDLPGRPLTRLARGERVVRLPDLTKEEIYRTNQAYREFIDATGIRSAVMVALRKDEALIGAIAVHRKEVIPVTEKQIALLQNFAEQAVIAMENARLLTETSEALEQQTATAEVLQVINSSPGDLAPVFDAMLDKAMRLCEANHAHLYTLDGDQGKTAAARGDPRFIDWFMEQGPQRVIRGSAVDRLCQGEPFVHMLDATAVEPYRTNPWFRELIDRSGCRTSISVPLRKDRALLGTIHLYRPEVRPFTDKQIALLQNFAAQAVIAMENARLLGELRQRTNDLQESLEYQTATSDVLKVISRSTFDLQPVLDALVATAARLTNADQALIASREGDIYRAISILAVSPEQEAFLRGYTFVPGRSSVVGRVVLSRQMVQIPDLAADPEYAMLENVRLGGTRTVLGVPLLREGEPIGVLNVARQRVEPFTEKQIQLVSTFADQAVIAIENARLLNDLQQRTRDLQESLEYQTATSDVLKVISRSTFDLQPVLDTLVETVARLCRNADQAALFRRDGEFLSLAASFGLPREFERFLRDLPQKINRGTAGGRAVIEGQAVHIIDASADPEYALREVVATGGARSLIGVPLFREGEPVGSISLARQRVDPFTEREVELVRTFADQAVIAIENTRLLTELRESLEQQQAIAEVLQVINSSPGDLQPVFEAMVEKARRLCGADSGHLALPIGDDYRTAAVSAMSSEMAAMVRAQSYTPGRGTAVGRALLEQQTVQIVDIGADPEHAAPHASGMGFIRAVIGVPLLREGEPVGAFGLTRREARPFTERQTELVRTFAAQAVIAMDNARLLDEIRQRQAELRVTFDNMGDGVAMFDSELRLAAWNLNFQRILDLPDTLLAERPRVADFIRYLATHGEFGVVDVEAEVRRLLERVETQWSAERTRPDGRVIEVRSNPVPGGGVVLIYSDITERKRAEAEIRAARDTAEKALQELQAAQASLLHAQKMAALGQLTAGIAHEIKNPLNFVNNFADLSGELLLELKETTAPAVAALGEDERAAVDEVVEMLRGNLDKIAEHGKRADGIVRSMLEHSRGVSGERRVVDLNALIEEALNLAYHGARAQDASFNITLEREFDRGLAPTELSPQEVTRVFLNLFGNGFYATTKRQRDGAGPEFRPTLKVATRDLGNAVEVRVRDNGTGIAPEIRDKLFQPFVTTKPTGEGTGLGLSISYDIVTQQHGGTITVDSEPGAFTEFTIRLPRH